MCLRWGLYAATLHTICQWVQAPANEQAESKLAILITCRNEKAWQSASRSSIYHSTSVKFAQSRLYLVQISGLWVHMNTINIRSTSSYIVAHYSLVTARVTAAKLLHKASTITFNNPHSARTISTGRRIIKTKRKRRKIPSSAHWYARWKLKQHLRGELKNFNVLSLDTYWLYQLHWVSLEAG